MPIWNVMPPAVVRMRQPRTTMLDAPLSRTSPITVTFSR